jgi:hypothetical protein
VSIRYQVKALFRSKSFLGEILDLNNAEVKSSKAKLCLTLPNPSQTILGFILMSHLTQSRTLTDALKIATSELRCIVQNVQLSIESLPKLPVMEGPGYFFKVNSDGTWRYWIDWTEDLGAWIDSDGHHATVVVSDASTNAEFDPSPVTCLASHIAATCLCLQGKIAIHANVVTLGNATIAFAGDSGQGKSTLTAYCVSRGAGFVTDDVLVLDDQRRVQPGSSRIKLFPHTGEQFGLDATQETLYKIHYQPERLGAVLHQTAPPLSAIYILGDRCDRLYSEALPPGKASLELIRHSYHTSAVMLDQHSLFQAYVDLVRQVPVKTLFYPRDFARLPDVFDFLAQDLDSLSS